MQRIGSGMRRGVAAVALVTGLCGFVSAAGGAAAATLPPCEHPVLVLSAMPLELSPLLRDAVVDPADTVHIDDRTFYVGRLAGNEVVLAMTGIGLVNAEETATAAFEHFRCPFRAALFSGVAGSKWFIADVNVPQRWTLDDGTSWFAVNAKMLTTARTLQGTDHVALHRATPVGDAACACAGVDAPTPVHLRTRPKCE